MTELFGRTSAGQEDMPITRDMFGEGKAGELAYVWISQGNQVCEAIVNDEGEKCGKRARGTVDFDVYGILEMVLYCGDEVHALKIEKIVDTDLIKVGMSSSFGRNGCGRNYDKPVDFSTRSTEIKSSIIH